MESAPTFTVDAGLGGTHNDHLQGTAGGTAGARFERVRAAMAGTVLVERGGVPAEEDLLAELALEWSGSLLLLR